MRTEPTGKKLQALLLLCCVVTLVASAESKDHNRAFSGQVVNSSNHGVPGVIVHLRPQDAAPEQSGSSQCAPPELCETTGHNGTFSFHQIKTGMYDLTISREGQLIYTKPEPLLVPEMPVNTHLVISLPQPPQN
ncbi:MAG: carboxypeptidase-like regulatory domain-containing protein [Candidatus Korobacteraceae bacterium]|jgi:hypothetical protein